MTVVSTDDMIENAVHIGHRVRKWNPRMKPYIFDEVNGIHFFDLEKTKKHLETVLEFLRKTVQDGKVILFVSTKPQTAELLPEVAKIHQFPYVTKKWFGGTLTNFETMKERIRYFKNLKEQRDTGEFEKYTKKERATLENEILKLENGLGGIQNLRKLPDVLFVVDAKRDLVSVKEAKKLKIPVVGICDTNSDPILFTHFVPANDDAMRSLTYLLGKVAEVLKSTVPNAKPDKK